METQGSIGVLPQELMQVIIHYTSLQAVSSIWMSGRYWHNKLANVLRHPKILMIDNTRRIVMIQNGKAYDMHKSRSIFYRIGSKPHSIVRLKYGWFDDVSSLKGFLEEFDQALRNNSNVFNPNIRNPFFVKVKPIDSEPQHYTTEESKHLSILDSTAYDRLHALFKNVKVVDPEPRPSNDEDADNEKHCVEGISLKIYNRAEESMRLEMHMATTGDINMKIYTPNKVEVNVQLRTSHLIFQELKEIIIYSKHMQQLPALKGDYEYLSFKSIFDLKCTLHGKKYYVQEYALAEDPKKLITNSYKNGSVKKIIQLLEPLLFNKSIPSPLHEGLVTSAPPTFSGHQLIRMPRLKVLNDVDLPSVLAIEVKVTYRQKYTLSLHSNVPMKEIVDLLRIVEQNMDYKDTKPCTHAIQVPPNEKITEIKIYSRKSLEPITRLKTSVVLDVWNMLIRSRVVYGFMY